MGETERKTRGIPEIQDLCREWMAEKKETLTPSSYHCYARNLTNHIIPFFDKMDSFPFTKELISSFEVWLEDGGLSRKTIQNILCQLRLICVYAAEKYKLPNPFAERPVSVNRPEKTISCFSAGEARQLEQYLSHNLTPGKLGILICLHTGLRLTEIAALRWEDIHWKENILHVRNAAENPEGKGAYQLVPLEGSWNRNIPIHRRLKEWLLPLKRERGYVLTGTEQFLNPRTYEYQCKKYYNEAFVRTLTFTALRDTFAVNRLQAGCDIQYLSELLGYAYSVNILSRYKDYLSKNKKELSTKAVLETACVFSI